MFNFKKIIINIFIIILIVFITGCGAHGPIPNQDVALNGISYTYYTDFIYDNNQYVVYNIDENEMLLLNGNIIYMYEVYNVNDYNENINSWTINYLKNNSYYILNTDITLSEGFMVFLKEKIEPKLEIYEEKLKISFDIYNDEELLEKEFVINNCNEYQKIYILDMYIPFAINNVNTNEVFSILVPIKTILGLEKQKVQLIYSENVSVEIDFNTFEYKNSIIKRNSNKE